MPGSPSKAAIGRGGSGSTDQGMDIDPLAAPPAASESGTPAASSAAIHVDKPTPSAHVSGGFNFALRLPSGPSSPSQSAAASPSSSAKSSSGPSTSTTTPTRRRPPPASIPNFPSAHEPRNPPPSIPFSPSPTSSPAQASPFRSPFATPPPPPAAGVARTPFLPIPQQSGAISPWHSLAATSGAPTPSLDGPLSSRGSPQLGYPFEQLNLGGSWSGANLSGGGSADTGGTPPFQLDSAMLPPPGGAASAAAPVSGAGPKSSSSLDAILARRRASLPKNTSLGLKSPSPLASSSSVLPAQSGSRLQPITPPALAPIVDRPTTLVLDVRAPSSFSSVHLASAHSLPVPSTLLRRPAFTVAKLIPMLDQRSQADVTKWQEMSDIVLVDQDSHTIAEGNILLGLASKFEREGFGGKLWYIKGGHQALQASGEVPLVGGEAADDASSVPSNTPATSLLSRGGLSRSAFQQGSVGAARQPLHTGLPQTPGFSLRGDPFVAQAGGASKQRRPNLSLRQSNPPQLSEASRTRLQPANPFFDNIRQNLELSHGGITERIPLGLPTSVTDRASELPTFLRSLVELPEKDSMDKLANQFYQIELGEQKRLQNIMNWHTRGSGGVLPAGAGRGVGRTGLGGATEQAESDAEEVDRLVDWGEGSNRGGYFPFSITAGVERGAKNRYKNIWPYDFSRVRLVSPTDDESDYINASYIQPRGTTRRYIATQGPLDATFRDFWTLVWEQHVLVIVMLTKQFEGGLIKCGDYWSGGTYGNIRLELVQQEGGEDKVEGVTSGFDFGQASRSAERPAAERNIKRVFLLSHLNQPSAPARRVTQIQCVSWPDFDVPDSPDVIVDLIKDVDAAVDDTAASDKTAVDYDERNGQAPVLVHCSAGVGRTGSFILVDAMLDGLRRERNAVSRTRKTPKSPPPAELVPPAYHRHGHGPSLGATSGGSGGFGSGSGDSINSKNSSGSSLARAVSMLAPLDSDEYPNRSTANLPSVFSESPSMFSAEVPSGAAPGGGMDVDTRVPGSAWPDFEKHRGSSTSSDDGTEMRRPSLVSAHTSSERMSNQSSEPHELDHPMPITASDRRHRTPSPLSDMSDPIADVLEGMRVQRMSLVQSLRQYLFVHRAIIHNYLAMVDEDKAAAAGETGAAGAAGAVPVPGAPAEAEADETRSLSAGTTASRDSRSSTAPLSASTAPTSVASSGTSLPSLPSLPSVPSAAGSSLASAPSAGAADDEAHIKRKPSPTELHPELPLVRDPVNLSKRASFKKMRPGPFEGAAVAGGGVALGGVPIVKSPTKKRSDRSDRSDKTG